MCIPGTPKILTRMKEDNRNTFLLWLIYYLQYKSKFWNSLLLLNYCCWDKKYRSLEKYIFYPTAYLLCTKILGHLSFLLPTIRKRILCVQSNIFWKYYFRIPPLKPERISLHHYLTLLGNLFKTTIYDFILVSAFGSCNKWLQEWRLFHTTDQREAKYFY